MKDDLDHLLDVSYFKIQHLSFISFTSNKFKRLKIIEKWEDYDNDARVVCHVMSAIASSIQLVQLYW